MAQKYRIISWVFRSLFLLAFSFFLLPSLASAQTCSFDGPVVDGKSIHYSDGTCDVYDDSSCKQNKNKTSKDCTDPSKPACCGAKISIPTDEGVSETEQGIVPCGRIEGTADEKAPCTLCHFIIGFKRIIDYILKILAYVAITCLVIAGIIYIVSAGNEKLISTAKGFIYNTLFGTAIVLLAWLAVNVVISYMATKPDLGVGATGLRETGVFKFECDTASSAMTGTTAQ